MLSPLPDIAQQVGADERTLRRAVSRGTIHGTRPGPRQLDIPPSERRYLETHWELISTLNRSLRTEPNIAFAALYGSMARGDERLDSDVDVLVQFREERQFATMDLATRLEHALDRHVDVTSLNRVRKTAPLLVLFAIDEARVLVDRDDVWPLLCAQRARFERRAATQLDVDRRAAAASFERLLSAPAA